MCSFDLISVGDITYTNWGITNNNLEPIHDTSKNCMKMCIDETNSECDGKWKVENCNSEKSYVCQIHCKGIFFLI